MEQTNIFSAYRQNLGKSQETLNVQLNIQNTTIGKILCLNSSAKIDSINALQGEALVNGTVFTTLVYLNEVNELKTEKTTTSFNTRVVNENITPLSQILGKVEIIENNITLATESEVDANIIVELELEQIAQTELNVYQNSSNNIKVKNSNFIINQFKTSNSSKFNVVGEGSIKLNTNEIFVAQVNTCVKSVTAGTGYFTVEGEIYVNYIAQSQDEDKPIKCFSETLSFKEEIENEQLLKDDLVLAYLSPVLNETVFEVSDNDGKVSYSITVPVSVNYIALNKVEQELPVDAFSTNCDVSLEYKDVALGEINPTKYVDARIDGSFTILDTEPRIAKISCVTPNNITLTKTYVNNETLIVEGIANVCVSYEADEDDIWLSSVQTEIPFSCALKNVVNENESVFVVASSCEATAKAKKGKEIDLDLDLTFAVDTYLNGEEKVLNNVIFGECYTKSEYALKVHVAPQGTTLWDLCKHLKTSEEIILQQNPNVTFPLDEATSIIYFNGRSDKQ